MVSKPPVELVNAQQAGVDALIALMHTTLNNMEKLASLNLSTMRDALHQGASSTQELLQARDPQAVISATQPTLERTRHYYHNLYELVLGMQQDITQVMESHFRTLSENAEKSVISTAAQVPVGGEALADTMKSLLSASTRAFEKLNQLNQQLNSQVNDSVQSVSEAVQNASTAAAATVTSAVAAVAEAPVSATAKAASRVRRKPAAPKA